MMPNNSPWIKQLNRSRPDAARRPDFKPDTVIVGGGIAGVSTAYFTLKRTQDKVLLLEGGKIAHGATGHNAGQVVSDFERYLADIAEEFGADMAIKGWQSVESAWLLAQEMIQDSKLQTPFFQFTGYVGFMDLDELLLHLRDHKLLLDNGQLPDSGINTWKIMVAEDSPLVKEIPESYKGLYSLAPHKDIMSLLETNDKRYYALVAARRGCMNSALFTEELVGYLLSAYPERFAIAENAWVDKVSLDAKSGTLSMKEGGDIEAKRIVLCTNGFERLKIENRKGIDIDTKFHHNVIGTVSYMAGYLDPLDKPPVAIAYFPKHSAVKETVNADPYFYLTRRPFENEKNERHNLICVGGPEVKMEDTSGYTDEHPYSAKAQQNIDEFFKGVYAHTPKGEVDYKFKWYGLMGYTPNGIRCIGYEPCNPVLMYNLGCNGIGILPSIYGGKRIAELLAGEKLEKSIFDPRDATCPIE
jgi:glycine/D-amino acid oxidase-like deaminating enzyme